MKEKRFNFRNPEDKDKTDSEVFNKTLDKIINTDFSINRKMVIIERFFENVRNYYYQKNKK